MTNTTQVNNSFKNAPSQPRGHNSSENTNSSIDVNTEALDDFSIDVANSKGSKKSFFSKLFSFGGKKKAELKKEIDSDISEKSIESLEEGVHILLLEEYLDVERCSEVLKNQLPILYKKYLKKKMETQILPLVSNSNLSLHEVLKEYEVDSLEGLWNRLILGDDLSLLKTCNDLVAPKIREATIAGMVRSLLNSLAEDKLIDFKNVTPELRDNLAVIFNNHLDNPTQKDVYAEDILNQVYSFLENPEDLTQDKVIRGKYLGEIKNLFQKYSNVSIDKNIKEVTKEVAKSQLDVVADFVDKLHSYEQSGNDKVSLSNVKALRKSIPLSNLEVSYYVSKYGLLNRDNVFFDHQDEIVGLIEQNYSKSYDKRERLSLEQLRDLFNTLRSQFSSRYGALMYDQDKDAFHLLHGIEARNLVKLIDIMQDLQLEYLEAKEEVYEAQEGSASGVKIAGDDYKKFCEDKIRALKTELDQFKKFFVDISNEEFDKTKVYPDRYSRAVSLKVDEYLHFYGDLYNVKNFLGTIHEAGSDINLIDDAFRPSLKVQKKKLFGDKPQTKAFSRTVLKNSLFASILSLSKNKEITFQDEENVGAWQKGFVNKQLSKYESLSLREKKKQFSSLYKSLSYMTDQNKNVGEGGGFDLTKFLNRRMRPNFVHDFVDQIFTKGTEGEDYASMGADLDVMTSLAHINKFTFKESGVFDNLNDYTLFKRLRKKFIRFLEQEQFIGNNTDPSQVKAFFTDPTNFQFYDSLETAIKNACKRSSKERVASFAFWYLVTLKYMPYEDKYIPEKVKDTYMVHKLRMLSLFFDPEIRSTMEEALCTAFADESGSESHIKGLFKNIEENHILQVNKLNKEITSEINTMASHDLNLMNKAGQRRFENLLQMAYRGFDKNYLKLHEQNPKDAEKYNIRCLDENLHNLLGRNPMFVHNSILKLKDPRLNFAMYDLLINRAANLAAKLEHSLQSSAEANSFQSYLDSKAEVLKTQKVKYGDHELIPWENDASISSRLKRDIVMYDGPSKYNELFAKAIEEEDSFEAAYSSLSSKYGHIFINSSNSENLKDYANLCNYIKLLKPAFTDSKYAGLIQANPAMYKIWGLLCSKPILINDNPDNSENAVTLKSAVIKSMKGVSKFMPGLKNSPIEWFDNKAA